LSRSVGVTSDPGSRRGLIYSACGASVCLTAADPELLDRCSRLYDARELPLDQVQPPTITVAAAAGGYSIVRTGTAPVLCTSRTDALAVLEHALTDALLHACRGVTQLHAAGAVVGGKAVIALGGSGAGKSSLALAWTMSGYRSLGDDVVLLDGTGTARPFPRHFKLDPDVLRSCGVDPETTPFWDSATQEAWFTPAEASGWAEPAPIGLVALCRRSAGARQSIERLSALDGVNALLHSVMQTGLDAASSFQPIVDALERAEVVEVRFGSSAKAASAIAECICHDC
jgi:hypothetical protein